MPFPYTFTYTFLTGPAAPVLPPNPGRHYGQFFAPGQTTSDFGYDVSTFPSLDVSFTPRNDVSIVADAFARRLLTPRGMIWSDENYGFDVRDFLNDEVTQEMLQTIRAGVQAQAEQEERILAASVKVAYSYRLATLRLGVELSTDVGDFSLVMDVSKVRTDIFVGA